MLKRAHTFEEIIGHDSFKKYLKDKIERGTLPQFLIFEGPLGLGKTSLAEISAIAINYGFDASPEREKAVLEVIDKGNSIDCIKRYNMAKDSGKDTAKEVLAELSPSMSSTGRKVIICDECHAISEAAQDVFLVETEFIPKNTYLFMCTTDMSKLKGTLVSRAAVIPLRKLTTKQMVTVLSREVESKNLHLQGGESALTMIAEWADNKPRAALNILNAFEDNEVVSTDLVREFIGCMDVSEITPLISSIAGSMTYGLTYISEMKTSESLLDVLVEMLRVKLGQPSYKFSVEDLQKVRMAVRDVPETNMMRFIHKLASSPKINKKSLLAAFISSHVAYGRLYKEDATVLSEEIGQKMLNMSLAKDIVTSQAAKAPTLDELLANSSIVGEDV